MNQIIYLAGRVSDLQDLNKPKFEAATRELRSRGFIVRNPHEICEDLEAHEWELCMRRCIAEMMKCEMILLLDDWMYSKGATLESYVAKQVGIHVETFHLFISNLDAKKLEVEG